MHALEDAGAPRYLVTSIARDGTLDGPDMRLYQHVLELTDRPVIASGGVRTADDIWALRDLGCEAAVTGKAVYEKTLKICQVTRGWMLAKRIIPCLDVDAGRVVKGVRFVELRDAGDPVELAARYDEQGADELVFLDITATLEGREATLDVISKTAEQVFIPLTVGGGVKTDDDARALLRAGADKVSLNSAAVRDPALLQRCADRFGTQCIVIAIDARRRGAGPDGSAGEGWEVVIDAGRTPTGREAIEWATEATAERGAGEVLLTSMDRDGTGTATTSSSSKPYAGPCGCRWWRAAVRASSGTSPRGSRPGEPTRCWRRAGSTTATSRSAT